MSLRQLHWLGLKAKLFEYNLMSLRLIIAKRKGNNIEDSHHSY